MNMLVQKENLDSVIVAGDMQLLSTMVLLKHGSKSLDSRTMQKKILMVKLHQRILCLILMSRLLKRNGDETD